VFSRFPHSFFRISPFGACIKQAQISVSYSTFGPFVGDWIYIVSSLLKENPQTVLIEVFAEGC